jgi:2-C-methyl-D-erythritol 4-phosphate cytidylyltransferase
VDRLQQKAADEWKFTKVKFVSGGATRHRSIAAGVAVVAADCDVVVVHDAVRPFVDEVTLGAVAAAAAEHGAAGTILPLVSTVIRVDADGFLQESLDRSLYRGSQTPQAFRREVIKAA